jgi:hypothetical protein
MPDAPEDWLVQKWFAGNHSDIGGSYPETESRLSDIALKWMVDEATSIPHPITVDFDKLHMFPAADGMQHDEVASVLDGYPGWFPRRWRVSWKPAIRDKVSGAGCHPSVLERFKLQSIRSLGVSRPYRPEALRSDPALKEFFEPSGGSGTAAPDTAPTRTG